MNKDMLKMTFVRRCLISAIYVLVISVSAFVNCSADENGNINCIDCEDCEDCIDCEDCEDCIGCRGCINCRNLRYEYYEYDKIE